MKFTKNELAKFMIANYKGEVQVPANFSADSVFTPEEAITNAFHSIIGTNENSTVEDYILAFRREDARLGVFAVIEEVLREGIIYESWKNPFFEMFVETRSQARGDSTKFYIESKQEVVVSRISKDGKVALDRQRFDEGYELTVETQTRGAKVYEHIARIMTRRTGWGKFVAALYEAMERDIAEMCYSAFATMVNNLPTQFIHRGTYDAAAIKEKIRNVKMASGASSVTLFGTELAIETLTLEAGAGANVAYIQAIGSDAIKDELHRTGRVGTWYGHLLVELPNGFQVGAGLNTNKLVMPDNIIYIVPNVEEKPVKLVVEPELIDINESSLARVDDTIEVAARWTVGAKVITGSAMAAFIKQ